MSPRDTPLGAGTEFDLIRSLRAHWGDVAVGIGDDAAVLPVPRGEQLVLSTDATVENVHFRSEWLAWEEVGYRAVTAALSDLAAMAAAPLGVLVALELSTPARDAVLQLAGGIADAARSAGTVILGGNLAHAGAFSMTTTVVGCAHAPLRRSGGRPGDLLYVTGALGGPAAALSAWLAGATPEPLHRARFARPVARIAEASWLAVRGASACIDVSDGLGGDVGHLAAAGDLAIEVQLERVPVVQGASERDAITGGEEYELLLLARAPLPETEFAERFGIPLTPIGRVLESGCDVRFTRDGRRVAAPAGYDHFSR